VGWQKQAANIDVSLHISPGCHWCQQQSQCQKGHQASLQKLVALIAATFQDQFYQRFYNSPH
jgi:hypothetical protein